MKILMTAESFLPRIGGGEMHVWYLMKHLKDRGHEVTLLTNEMPTLEATRTASRFPEPPRVTRIPWRRSNMFKMFRFLWKESATAEVLHAHYSYRLAMLVGIVGRLRRKPVVVTLHGLGTLNEKRAALLPRLSLSTYRFLSLTLATRVISTSKDIAEIAWKYAPRSKRKTTIIFNGIDGTLFNSKVEVPVDIEDKYQGKKVILTVRRLVPKNGVHFLVEALPWIIKEEPDALLVLVGSGRLVEHIRTRVVELGLSEYVDIVGDKENTEVPGFVKRADVIVFPSTAESTSIACAEAMALGTPVVASRVGGLIELLGANEERGRLVTLVDHQSSDYEAPLALPEERYQALARAVVETLREPDLQRTEAALEFAHRELDWNVITEKTIDAYQGPNKSFYTDYNDEIYAKRFRSKYPLRAYAHRMQYEDVARHVAPGMRVLDAGCGDGVLSIMMAERGAHVVGTDISRPNIERCRAYAEENNLSHRAEFLVADSEALPFADASFDLVVSSHVLEHLPSFDDGLSEIMRVTKKRAVVAIPTVMNPCSLVQVGGGMFYLRGLRMFAALPFGFIKMLWALLVGEKGVDESYAGYDVPHVFRFPWIMHRRARKQGVRVVSQSASSMCLPYFPQFLPLIKKLDQYREAPILKNLGYGTTYVLEKKD